MALIIRKAVDSDAAGWLQLLREALGSDEVAEQVYDLERVGRQLVAPQIEETWVAEVDGRLRGSISILGSSYPSRNPVANLGRYVVLPSGYNDGTAEALIAGINQACRDRGQIAVMRVPASDYDQQWLLEGLGYVCVGFQPLKHLCMVREGILFYIRIGESTSVVRLPLSQSLPLISELASTVLQNLQILNPEIVRDGLTGYPLQTELRIEEAEPEVYEASKAEAHSLNPAVEISGQFNRGMGVLRVGTDVALRTLLGYRDGRVVAGLSYYFDDHDKFVRLVDSFSTDDLSAGAMLAHAVKVAQAQFNAVYVEVDFLITAPRILKSAERLGFLPVAYLPGFYNRDGCGVDLVKMVKLNALYTLDNVNLTPQAKTIVEIVDRSCQDQKVGIAVIGLLRELPIFTGLGDGELAKIARLFTQKLYRPGERVFQKGDSSNEAYIVMRGQVEICLEEGAEPVASVATGAIIGEQAFLDDSPRDAMGFATQPSILLVMQRPAFHDLVHSEPQLGMVVMRNIAIEVSNKLRKADAALTSALK